METWNFLQMFWKDDLSKKFALEYDLSCINWIDGIFFTGKCDVFYLEEKWKMIFLNKIMEIWYFLYIYINVARMILPLCKKYKRQSSPKKTNVKVIGILDWHSRKSSSDSMYFYGGLHRHFIILLSSEKNKKRKI